MNATTYSSSYRQPMVPPLYFERTKTKNDSETSSTLPPEILSLCLTAYANWGDLAKLACVQKSWSNLLVDSANQSTESKWELAQALLKGDCGLAPNAERAVQILKELAVAVPVDESGKPLHTDTQANDNTTNNTCFTPAAKQLAECYLMGQGVPQDSKLGLAWLEAAFYYGHDAEAAHDIALIYEYGRHSIEVDVVAAAQWFERGAEAGNVESMAELGLCYELGCGVEQSDEQALDWYTKAANLGHATAKFSVGEIFEEARGVPQSDEEACLWYYRAALVGDQDSKVALRRLYDIARIVVPGVADILNE
ncbi:Sel1 repeat-containing protein [Nitzschia inconspicua]|uniref:Sel1 repeat-containing protein n=1 Tax=Nitzschia inconspicua TaxID=303405 RepID=A0A9K3PND9_9STRA|nr:Sel1 repeat-containing protein [Nitzschia inconspicua]